MDTPSRPAATPHGRCPRRGLRLERKHIYRGHDPPLTPPAPADAGMVAVILRRGPAPTVPTRRLYVLRRDPRTTPALICRSLHRPSGWYTHMLTRTLQDFLIYACAGTVIFRKICGGQVRDTALVEGLDKHRKESLRHEPLLLDSTQTVHARIVHPSP